MADLNIEYAKELRERLSGRIPAPEIESLVTESSQHLQELTDELRNDPNLAEQEAVRRFGTADLLARAALRSRRTRGSVWKASLVPVSILVFGYASLLLLPYHYFQVGPFHSSVQSALLFLMLFSFGFLCCLKRRLFILQIMLGWLMIVSIYLASNWDGIPMSGGSWTLQKTQYARFLAMQRSNLQSREATLTLVQQARELVVQLKPPKNITSLMEGNEYYLPNHFLLDPNVRSTESPAYPVFGTARTSLASLNVYKTKDWQQARLAWAHQGWATAQTMRRLIELSQADVDQTIRAAQVPGYKRLGLIAKAASGGAIGLFMICSMINLIAWCLGWLIDFKLPIKRKVANI